MCIPVYYLIIDRRSAVYFVRMGFLFFCNEGSAVKSTQAFDGGLSQEQETLHEEEG